MTYLGGWLAFIAGLIVSLVFSWCRRKCSLRCEKTSDFRVLSERLYFYAMMKDATLIALPPAQKGGRFCQTGMYFSPVEHEILLGALKKVEGKLVAMIAIIVFALPVLGSLTVRLSQAAICSGFIAVFTIGVMVAILILGADGTMHFGQSHYRSKISDKHDLSKRGRALQEALALDLLRKESDYDSAFRLLTVATVLMLFSSALPIICDYLRTICNHI